MSSSKASGGPAAAPTAEQLRQQRRQEKESWRRGERATHGLGPGDYGRWDASTVPREQELERQRGRGVGRSLVRPGLPLPEAEEGAGARHRPVRARARRRCCPAVAAPVGRTLQSGYPGPLPRPARACDSPHGRV
jgi:hypothetical protein